MLLIATLLLSSCAIKGYIPDDKSIVTSNHVVIDSSKTEFSRFDIIPFISLKPTHSFFGFMPRVWLYYKTEDKTNKKFWRWVNENLGNKPTYLSTISLDESEKQIITYLNNIGYFKSVVYSSYITKRKRTNVTYKITPSKPYKVQNKGYDIADSTIRKLIAEIFDDLPLKTGKTYNAYTLDDERDKITEYLRNNGYYYFSKDYIYYDIDTNFMQQRADITLRIENVYDSETNTYIPHKQYNIRNVFINPNYNSQEEQTVPDTTEYVFSLTKKLPDFTFHFVNTTNPKIRYKTFNQVIQIHPNEKYSLYRVSQTYRGLNNLKIYNKNYIEFTPLEIEGDSINYLDCNINLHKGKLNYYNIQVEGTNSGGDLGILGKVTFRNKNIFRGSEVFNINFKAGIQAQSVTSGSGDVNNTSIFNTKELGIDVSILFPRFLSFFGLTNFVLEYQPRTSLTAGYNMQIRSIYSRYILTAGFGYNWMQNQSIQHILTPINLNSVKVNPSEEFKKLLDQETNQRIKDQYTNHLIFGLDYSFIFSNQNIRTLNDFFYIKIDFESSGNLLSLFNKTKLLKEVDDHHEIFGISYSQYLKFSVDFRFYHYFGENHQIVLRQMVGLGIPYGNSYDMPFEKSFFAGGSNGMRGWHFRDLGPGGFSNPQNLDIERIGDIQLEFNVEYRFPIYSFLKGAIFTDMGNIWISKESSTFVDGKFDFNTFYKQLAIDAGIGFRFDFSFFLVRVDVAAPIRDPEYPENERWRLKNLKLTNFIWNFGIGYPF